MNRRDVIKAAIGAAAAGSTVRAAEPSASRVLSRMLGRTGERVSAIGVGGFHLSIPPEKEAIEIIRTALDAGVNFLDNCWDYANGVSEERMGKALRDGYRKRAFLMTKIDGRTAASAKKQI